MGLGFEFLGDAARVGFCLNPRPCPPSLRLLKRPAAAVACCSAGDDEAAALAPCAEPGVTMPSVGAPCKPIAFRGCTIYTSLPHQAWRVKPWKGSRFTKVFSWCDADPKHVWSEVVEYCKSPYEASQKKPKAQQ